MPTWTGAPAAGSTWTVTNNEAMSVNTQWVSDLNEANIKGVFQVTQPNKTGPILEIVVQF